MSRMRTCKGNHEPEGQLLLRMGLGVNKCRTRALWERVCLSFQPSQTTVILSATKQGAGESLHGRPGSNQVAC